MATRTSRRLRPSRSMVGALAVILAGCTAPARGGFDQLSASDQGMFRRCRQPLAQHLCAGADEAAQARCLETQTTTFARRSTKMRRRWLELNQCPAALIDGPDEPVAAAEPPAEPKAEPGAEPAAAPVAEAAPAPTPAAAPALLAAGAACQRSAACESDLCVRGVCVELAMIEIGKAVHTMPAAPAKEVVTAAEPAPAAPAENEAAVEKEPEPAQAPKKPAEPAAPPERVASSVRLASASGAPDQLRGAIVEHEAEMKRCVERQLKLVPDLRAEGTLVLEVSASGRVTQAALRGERLQGTPLENCMRAIAARWVFPRTSRAYAVEAPLKVSGVEGRRQ